MATDLRAIPGTEVTQTRFAGGKERGVCIQLTGIQDNTFQQLQFTREQARMVAQELLLFACLLYTSPSPRDLSTSRMPSSA